MLNISLVWVLFGLVAYLLAIAISPSKTSDIIVKRHTPLDIAIIGDSRPHVGLSPERLTHGLSDGGHHTGTIYNLAEDGSGLAQHVSLILQGLLNQSPIPKLIIWAPNPLSFDEHRLTQKINQLRVEDLQILWSCKAPLESTLDVATGSIFTPYRCRSRIRDLLTELPIITKVITGLQKRILSLQFNERIADREYLPSIAGYEPFRVIDWKIRFESASATYLRKYARLQVGEWEYNATRFMLQKARHSGCHVIVVELPVAPWYREYLSASRPHVVWRNRMQRLCIEEGATFVDDSDAIEDNESFGDPGHMSVNTAERYSLQFGQRITGIPEVQRALQGKARTSQ
ncbi:MAG: hypothetical protein WCO60_02935 [Verrucomicrobiota bacterium]